MKMSVVGTGRVGQAVAFAAVIKGAVDELVLVGRSPQTSLGDALDLRHASCFMHPVAVRSGTSDDTAGSDVIVVTASASKDPTGADRRLGARANAALFRELIPPLARMNPDAVFIIVSNPVDALTQLAQDLSGLPHRQVLGTGTLIDTVRLRALLSEYCGVHPVDLRVYVLGEHGDAQVALLSAATAGGAPIDVGHEQLARFTAEARDGGYAVARAKGYTSHAVAMAVLMIVEAIGQNSLAVLPVTTRLCHYYGVHDICLSVPTIIGRTGATRVLQVQMNDQERAAFEHSGQRVRDLYALMQA